MPEVARRRHQSVVLGECEECRRERVSLLAAVPLADLVPGTGVIPPVVPGAPRVPLAHEGRERRRHRLELVEEGGAMDVIVGPDAIETHDRGAFVHVGRCPEQ